MSLGVAGSSTPPLTRPLPPSRSKRSSLNPPRRSGSFDHLATYGVEGVLGGLRERSDDELARADGAELRSALKEQWAFRDLMAIKVDELEREKGKVEEYVVGLEQSVQVLQERYDEALNEQGRLEGDLEQRDELLERLRATLRETEKHLREASRRAIEQERSFEAERSALQAQEAHLNQRIRSLLSTPRQAATTTPGLSVEDLKEELASMNVSHSTILAQLNTLTKENYELRLANDKLVEDQQGWELLLRERTFSGKVLQGQLFQGGDCEERGPLAVLDEELEMDELNSDLDAQSPIFEEDLRVRNLDAEPLSSPVLGESKDEKEVGLDLAAELGRAEEEVVKEMPTPRATREKALRDELSKVKEENKALSLYCKKILDRIVSQEGFEHVLSQDYKTRRMGSRSGSSSGRPPLREVLNTMENTPPSTESQTMTPDPQEPLKKARPLSMMSRAFSGSAASSPVAPPPEPIKADVKEEKKARRGFSIDFRALGFGGSTSTTPTEQKPNPALRPLSLASKTTPPIPSKPLLGSANQARRLERTEEDEDDRRERHRLEATLKLMGMDKTSDKSGSSRKLTKAQPPRSDELEYLISQRPTPSPDTTIKRSSPLTRLSSALSSPEPETVRLDDIAPELREEALKAFDKREAEQVRQLSLGKAPPGYTTPSSMEAFRKNRERKREASGESSADKKVTQSTSISTLWSIGSGSRPTSMEAQPKPVE